MVRVSIIYTREIDNTSCQLNRLGFGKNPLPEVGQGKAQHGSRQKFFREKLLPRSDFGVSSSPKNKLCTPKVRVSIVLPKSDNTSCQLNHFRFGKNPLPEVGQGKAQHGSRQKFFREKLLPRSDFGVSSSPKNKLCTHKVRVSIVLPKSDNTSCQLNHFRFGKNLLPKVGQGNAQHGQDFGLAIHF
jgi:hypothetical protein